MRMRIANGEVKGKVVKRACCDRPYGFRPSRQDVSTSSQEQQWYGEVAAVFINSSSKIPLAINKGKSRKQRRRRRKSMQMPNPNSNGDGGGWASW